MRQRERRKGRRHRFGWIARVGPLLGLAALLAGCATTVTPGFVDDGYYPYPYDPYPGYYDYGYYGPDIYIRNYPYHRHYVPEYHHRGFDDHRAVGIYRGSDGRHAVAPHRAPNAGGFSGSVRGGGHGGGHTGSHDDHH